MRKSIFIPLQKTLFTEVSSNKTSMCKTNTLKDYLKSLEFKDCQTRQPSSRYFNSCFDDKKFYLHKIFLPISTKFGKRNIYGQKNISSN